MTLMSMHKLTHSEIVERQNTQNFQRLPFSVIVNNVRSLYNVGSIFRTADGAGVEKIWLCGITGTPGTARSAIEKTALGAEKSVPWEYRESAASVIRELKTEGYEMILLEQARESVSYETFDPNPPACLVLGNEIAGIDEEIVSLCDRAIEIEMAGLKNSLNVTVAFGIAAYHLRNQLKAKVGKTEFYE